MAIYHFSAQVASRSAGRSAVAMAAYRSGDHLEDERTGETKFYRRDAKPESLIIAPEHSPEWIYNRNRLWNEVEKGEKRKDAQLCREINVALPKEFSSEVQNKLLSAYCQREFVDRGMIADVAIHRDDDNNPHAHVMLTMREIGPEGFGKKVREWNERELIEKWREAWAQDVNQIFEKDNRPERIDHRSLEAQGINRLPSIHEGPTVREMEQRGKRTDRGTINQTVREHNAVVVELEAYRIEKAAQQQKEAEKVLSGRQEGQLVAGVNEEIQNSVQGRGGKMNVIEQRPDMAYQFYTERKEKLDKEYGLNKRREQFVKEREGLASSLESERLNRGEKAEIRGKIETLDKQISKIPELTEVSKSIMREEYKTIEAKLQEVFKVADRRAARKTDLQPQPIQEKASAPVIDLKQVEAIKQRRDTMFNERNSAEHSFTTLQRKQDLSQQRSDSLEKELNDLGPNRWWQRGKNAQREQLQRNLDVLKKEIADRTPELETAKVNFEKSNKEYQELSHSYRAIKEIEHKEKQQQRVATKQFERER